MGVLALALMAGGVVLTGMFLTGQIRSARVPAAAVFGTCGQGLRVGGDVKERGVLVGRIDGIERLDDGRCRVELALFPTSIEQIPANVGAQVRAKTIFGEKWVELLYPEDPADERLAADDVIEETIDPLEVETILNVALPLLDAIDPEYLAGALEALASGFTGHEGAAIRGIEAGSEAVRVANENTALFKKGVDQLAESAEVFNRVDEDLLASLRRLDELNNFTTENSQLIAENLEKAPALLRELSVLFETRIVDLTRVVDSGATVVGVLAARASDIDRLLEVLPVFNSSWIRNLDHTCTQRSTSDVRSQGERVPGRCWRVHNLLSQSQGEYAPGEEPNPDAALDYSRLGFEAPSQLERVLFAPAAEERT
ncbi:MAG TPA: MCE family protein [Actinomycetota bacterium]|nr:MCE family protein [Actinomycetota bacterium]